jgi:hypothetical protein
MIALLLVMQARSYLAYLGTNPTLTAEPLRSADTVVHVLSIQYNLAPLMRRLPLLSTQLGSGAWVP